MAEGHWHKSSYSNGNNASCVEVSEGRVVLVRDTQNRELSHLEYPTEAWVSFLGDLKDGCL